MARRSLSSMTTTVHRRAATTAQVTTAQVDGFVADAHRRLAEAYAWSYRKRETVIQTVAEYTTGTIGVTADSGTVNGTSTVFVAAHVGRMIAIPGDNTFFYVRTRVSNTELTLGDADGDAQTWVAASGSGKSYSIRQHQFAVPSDVAVIMSKVREWPLFETTQQAIDAGDPRRTATGTPDRWCWARAAIVSNVESRYIELWPVPITAMTFRMPYLIQPPELTAAGNLPVCPSEVIEWDATMEIASFLLAKTGDPRWGTLMQNARLMLYGNAGQPGMGVLEAALFEDQKRWSLPNQLQDSQGNIGYDRLKDRDWAL